MTSRRAFRAALLMSLASMGKDLFNAGALKVAVKVSEGFIPRNIARGGKGRFSLGKV